ncbi:MAG TPA: chlorite dismutase family protein [Candidatus Dormibacteraeota bacterium]|nr:chlorite dismutase family protein [Candidatus Dormibacteraeota bacterium]
MAISETRQFVSYTFYKIDPSWRRLDANARERGREEFKAVIAEFAPSIFIKSYSLAGTKADCDFMLWKAAFEVEIFNKIEAELNQSAIGGYLNRSHSFLCTLRRSVYLPDGDHGQRHGTQLKVKVSHGKYLFVYPFVKTRAWYGLPAEERKVMMEEHFEIGHRYPEFELNTAYSFGLDDQEFVVSFEGDSPHRFLDLVMELRGSRGSAYTQRDTPTFMCIAMPLDEVLSQAG